MSGTWDHHHPCAILVKLLSKQKVLKADIERTLDANGYIMPDGSMNIESAIRECDRKIENE